MVPNKRTLTVLGALVVGMTLTSIVLLALEPGPVAPLSGVTLQSIDGSVGGRSPAQKLFDITAVRSWKAIVIHDSGSTTGSARTLNAIDQRLGRGGLGYDFVLDNGSLKPDGLIEVGFRWRHQYAGAYLEGKNGAWFNRHAVGICLIGDGDHGGFTKAQLNELMWLVQRLQGRFNIPKDAVFVDVGRAGHGPAKAFPHAWFRKQLLSPRSE